MSEKRETGKDPGRLTMLDIARHAGVSLGTVSRVVNGHVSVAPELRARVEATMRELDYEPNSTARSLRTRSTRVIACIVSDINNPLFAQSVGAAEEVLYRASYAMVLMNSMGEPARESELFQIVRRRGMDGLITTVSEEDNADLLAQLRSLRIPVIQLERDMPLPYDSVLSDQADGTQRAADYLMALGHRRIGLITVTTKDWPGRERQRGFLAAHAQQGLAPNPNHMAFEGFSVRYGYSTAIRMLGTPGRPTALIVGANQLVGVLHAVRNAKLRIPHDLSIVAIGDAPFNLILDPPVTAIAWDVPLIGRTAADLLLRRLAEGLDEPRVRIALPVDLILRGSCGPPPT